eukprot:scaffold9118_cov139-Skeletonema_dohrnii-CCMP3373.AAC.4
MPKKRANSRTASSGSASSAASSSTNRSNSNSTTTSSNNNTTGGNDGDNNNNNSLPIPGNFIGGMQLTPAMVREFMEASKKAGIDHNGGIVNQRGNSRHVTGDLNKLVAMANASSSTAAAAAAAAAGNNKGGGNNSTNGQAKNNNNTRGKVTGVKIVRQTVPFVGPPPPPGHASSTAQKGGGPQKPVAMGVSATFSKADGSTATVDLDAAAIASMMSQANSNNPEAFNAGLKQILAAASSAAAAQQSSSSSGSSSQQQQQTKQSSAEASYNAMSALSASCPVGKRNALLANKIASSYGSLGGEDDNSKSTSSGNNSKTSSKKKSSNTNSTAQQQHQQNTAQIQSLFSSLFNMAQQMDSSGSSSSTTTPSQESIQNDFASFRKAAFVAGVNVAIQQEAEREAQHEMEKMNQQKLKKQSSKQEAVQQQKSVKQKQQPKSKKKEGASASSATATAKSNVFSMIFGGGGSSKSKASSSSATTSSTSSSTNKNGSSTTSTNSASAAAVVPIIPPPPGGFPQDSLVAQAASVLADYGTNASDDDENLNLAVSLGNRLLKSVNMSLDTEDDARRAYEKVTSCLSAEERNIVDSFATNFADLPDDGGVGGGFGCLPEELLNVMSKSMASVMNLDNPGVMERLAQEMDRVKKVSSATTTTPPPQDRPTFEHLPDDDKTRQHKNEQEAAAREKAKAEEEERKRQEEAEEEERKRELKASKRRDKKARQKERLKKEAELKAAAAAIKKRERTITSWRSRVIAACASGDARKMNMLIGESPYRNFTFTPVSKEGGDEETNDDGPKNQEEYLLQQLNWFLPNCLQKYQTRGGASFDALPFEFNVARELLAKYILSTSFDVFREPVPTYSRTCIHSAAYANDVDFIKWVLQSSNDNEKGFLETPCTDAGWTPLHYATAGGAKSALELLMAEKCNVKARSNPSLTCFRTFTPYQSSNGLTARELAVVLQAGAVDDDLTSKAAILDEIVDKRIVNVTAADKTSYMRILKAIEERLKEVEKNGYWPLPEDEEQIALIFEETPPSETTTSAALPKKKSKKKNKKKAKETNPPPAPPAASPEPEVAKGKSSSGDDLSDPVAVALLGMGFSEEQIKAAAKAFGGYVGADDMVMWILSGGDTSSTDQSDTNSQQNSQARSKDSVSITSSTKSFTTKAQTKALTRAQKKVEEAAQKRQEEIANAQKAAAKREEQRRLRREWNEREQARQQEEKNAKLAKALERQRQAEMEKMMAEPKGPPGPGGIPMSINIGGGGGKGGPPMTIVAGGKKASKKSNMGIPQAPTVKAPKILARPSDASKSSAGNQPLFTKPAASSKSSSRASKPGNPSTHQPTMILKKGAKPQPATKGISASAPEFRPPGVSDGSISSAGSAGKQTFPVQKSAAKKAVPPGFQPAMPGKASDQPAATPFVEPNHMGLIRATAREFVPSFAPSPVSEENVVPSMSAQSSGKRAPAPQPTASSNESASNAPAAAASLIEPMSSLLSNVSSSPAPPTTLTQTVGVDPTVSAASSITGLSGTLSEEKPPTSRVGSIMTFESNTATGGGLQGSSILESISYGATADHHQSNGLGNIWGGGGASNTNQTDTLGGLGGFDFSSFMQDDALSGSKNDNRDTKGNTSSLGGNALGNNTWGGNGAIGGDSIW